MQSRIATRTSCVLVDLNAPVSQQTLSSFPIDLNCLPADLRRPPILSWAVALLWHIGGTVCPDVDDMLSGPMALEATERTVLQEDSEDSHPSWSGIASWKTEAKLITWRVEDAASNGEAT